MADFLNQGFEDSRSCLLVSGVMSVGVCSCLLVISLGIVCRQQWDLFHFQEPKTFWFYFSNISGIFSSSSLSLYLSEYP